MAESHANRQDVVVNESPCGVMFSGVGNFLACSRHLEMSLEVVSFLRLTACGCAVGWYCNVLRYGTE